MTDKIAVNISLEIDIRTIEHLVHHNFMFNEARRRERKRALSLAEECSNILAEAMRTFYPATRPLSPTEQAAVARQERIAEVAARGWTDGRLPR